MTGSNRFSAVCTIKFTLGDKTNSDAKTVMVGPGTEFPFITGVTVQRVFQRTGQVTLSIDAPFHEGREMLNSPLFYTGNTIDITLRYPDDPRSVLRFTAVVLKGGIGLTLSPNGIQGSITAEGCTQVARVVRAVPMAETETPYDWLTKIVTESGYSALNASDQLIESINQSGFVSPSSDYLFDIFERFCAISRITWLEDPETREITIFDDKDIDTEKVQRVFVMRDSFIDTAYLNKYEFLNGNITSNPRVYPIVSYSPEISAGFFTHGEAVKVTRTGIRHDGTRDVASIDENSADVKQTTKSADPAAGSQDIKAGSIKTVKAFEEGEAGEVIPLSHPESLDASADAEVHRRAVQSKLAAYNANLTTFGIPDITPGERIAVVGLGDLLDGIFIVKEVNHTWSAGKIETSIGIYGRNGGIQS